MPGSPCHFTFHDSSDDENNEHVAEILSLAGDNLVHTTSLQNEQQPQRQSLVQRALAGIARALGTAFPLTQSFATSESSRDPLSGSTELHRRGISDANEPIESVLSVDPSEQDELTLLELIEQYNRTPDDVYMRIILASLTAENVVVNGEMFRAAAGNCKLIEMLLQSRKVDVDDPDVQLIIQSEIDAAVIGDEAHGGRLAPEKIVFLRMLCGVPSATLTRKQAQLCVHSGFEFVAMLKDSRHVLRNISPPGWIIARLFDLLYIIEGVINALSLVAILLNIVCVMWVAYFWFTHTTLYSLGYWTVSCYLIGYLFSIVATMTSEEGRMRHYEHHIWNYPDNSLKVLPVIPLFEIALMYVMLRYRAHKEKNKYFVISYDLYNGAINLFIIDTLFLAMPQVLMQYYFFNLYAAEDIEFAGYKLLVVVTSISYGMSIILFIRKVMHSHSCNNFGFAVVASMQAPTMPVDITLRILILMLVFFMECNVVSITFSILHIGDCTEKMTAFVITLACVEVVVILGVMLALVFERPRLTVVFCLPIFLIQIVFSIYVGVTRNTEDNSVECELFALTSSLVSPFNYITFGLWSVSLFLWIAFFLYYRITGKQLYPHWNQFYLTELRQ